ncbi:MAG TPA: hypothetical protein VH142_01380 [Polyangiaceae bacterium]|nr:hypothetical protein [Polyangiaceae bacterium]
MRFVIPGRRAIRASLSCLTGLLAAFAVYSCGSSASSGPGPGAGGTFSYGGQSSLPSGSGGFSGGAGFTGSGNTGNPGAGNTGAAGSIANLEGGVFSNPPVDPTIQFNWPVDNPSPSLTCEPGHYAGTFTGFYASYLTFVGVPIPVAGNVDLRLDQSSNGEFYTITDGTVQGTVDVILAQYKCDIVGTLDCAQKKLVNGRLENCTYCVGVFLGDSGICGGVEGHFAGPLTADYDAANQSFENGLWKGVEPTPTDSGIYGGSGQWTAAYTGP